MTGPTPKTREMVRARAGDRCERCGAWTADGHGEIHHRTPRGMGGSRRDWINRPSNLLLLCNTPDHGCHAWVEANRSVAYAQGFLVRRPFMPSEMAVRLGTGWVLLTDDGQYVKAAA